MSSAIFAKKKQGLGALNRPTSESFETENVRFDEKQILCRSDCVLLHNSFSLKFRI